MGAAERVMVDRAGWVPGQIDGQLAERLDRGRAAGSAGPAAGDGRTVRTTSHLAAAIAEARANGYPQRSTGQAARERAVGYFETAEFDGRRAARRAGSEDVDVDESARLHELAVIRLEDGRAA